MLARGGPDPLRVAFVSSKTNKINSYGAGTGNDLPEPLSWNMQLPNLFKFGYFCKVEDGEWRYIPVHTVVDGVAASFLGDINRGHLTHLAIHFLNTHAPILYAVPPELVHPVIWALKMYHRVLSECTSQQLYDAGHYLRHQEPESANAFMVRIRFTV